MAVTHTLTQRQGTVRNTIEFPVDLYDQLEQAANARGVSKKQIVLEALRKALSSPPSARRPESKGN